MEVAGGVAAAVIDGDPKVGRRRMSLAHELGHWLFGDPYDVGAQDAERMINSFAAHFLAPRSGVTMAWGCDPSRSVRDKAVFVAGAFRMSWTAAILHLRNLNLITDTDYRALETRLPVPGEFAKLGITLNADELKAPSLSPVSPPRSSRRTWIGGCLRRGRRNCFAAASPRTSFPNSGSDRPPTT